MVRVVTLLIPALLGASILQKECDRCHQERLPYQMLYKRALLLYSSKARILKNLSNFLIEPDPDKSVLPPGLKMRFDPAKHPRYDPKTAKEAIRELIEKEDILKKFRFSDLNRSAQSD